MWIFRRASRATQVKRCSPGAHRRASFRRILIPARLTQLRFGHLSTDPRSSGRMLFVSFAVATANSGILVRPTPLPLSCRETPCAASAADEVRCARGASAPGQTNGPRSAAAACWAAAHSARQKRRVVLPSATSATTNCCVSGHCSDPGD